MAFSFSSFPSLSSPFLSLLFPPPSLYLLFAFTPPSPSSSSLSSSCSLLFAFVFLLPLPFLFFHPLFVLALLLLFLALFSFLLFLLLCLLPGKWCKNPILHLHISYLHSSISRKISTIWRYGYYYHGGECINNQWITSSSKEGGTWIFCSHPLCRMCFGQYQAYSAVTGRWGLLSHAKNAVRWMALSIWW